MSSKRILRDAGISAAAIFLGSALLLGLMAGPAGASSLTSADGNTVLSTTGVVAAGTPYDSSQPITVTVNPNNVISTTNLAADGYSTSGDYYVEECTDLGGTTANLPQTSSGCESLTVNASALKTSSGGFTLSGVNAFKVYDLPDYTDLGGPGTMTGVCDVAPDTCVLGIFAAPPASGGFSEPHLFSAPFQVTAGDGNDDDASPGDGTPEVPLALLLPLLAAGLIGGATFFGVRRRRKVKVA
jgi:hypothetical protein